MKAPRSIITLWFNVLLILYSAGTGFFTFVFSDKAQNVPIEGLVLTSLIDLVRYLIMMFISAWFIREAWNRLVADLFTLRLIAYREAITMVVLLGLFSM
ncbi:MAG: hypothetical protein ACF8AM_18735 [Rhodopirellula sp. JB055]|uniref:hypothetical protein n=1 Tax=Rhodopirellula sp. JB055 TaxID=3342846 RepID=UPI00370B8026